MGPRPTIFYTANGGKVVQSVAVGMSDLELDWVFDLDLTFVSVAARPGPEYRIPRRWKTPTMDCAGPSATPSNWESTRSASSFWARAAAEAWLPR